jgi:hypothetical protein
MKIAAATLSRHARIERGLPIAGPALALGSMLVIALFTPVMMMVA